MLRVFTFTTNVVAAAKAGAGGFLSGQVRKLRKDESGATAIEYGLIAAGIAVAIIGIVFTLGNDIADFFQAVDTKLTSKTPT
jgi:pilus assembly protein Flp/PilA